MSLYPSLEDLKVDRAMQAQAQSTQVISRPPPAIMQAPAPSSAPQSAPVLYPSLMELNNYMGLSLTDEELQLNLSLVPSGGNEVAVPHTISGGLIAPVTGNDVGLRRAEIKHGMRELILCKDEKGKVGLRLRDVDKGIFVQLVQANSPASLVGLRFGDQILQINEQDCAGWSTDKAHKALKKAGQDRISMIVRDRPFQRTITLQKDSAGQVGFIVKKGQISSLVKDSSAARNGLLTNHYLCEVNGQNVIGLKDRQIVDILASSSRTVTVTVIPAVIFEHIIKRMSSGIMKNSMDHSIPEV
ncbi:syntenin-2 [Rana temporaria]|uniref:syntenin-2 n=1 Tax=Rana temporaria TaxID=8407 RepID=UPI001AADFF6D|nr:syntenin-2 [Rana temporaria]